MCLPQLRGEGSYNGDQFVGPPEGGRLSMWLVGVLVAAVPVAYGISCLVTGRATFLGESDSIDIEGPAAGAYAIACIALGSFIHFHWFWAAHTRLWRFSYIFKVLAALVFIASFGYSAYRVLA